MQWSGQPSACKFYNKNLPPVNVVLKMYWAILLHAKCITIKHKVMLMKRRKKMKNNAWTDKMSTFSLKEEKQFGECFLMRISRNRHFLESSNNLLKLSPLQDEIAFQSNQNLIFFIMPSEMLRIILSIVLLPPTWVHKAAIVLIKKGFVFLPYPEGNFRLVFRCPLDLFYRLKCNMDFWKVSSWSTVFMHSVSAKI